MKNIYYYAIALEDSKDTYYDIPLVKKGEKQNNVSTDDLEFFKQTGKIHFYIPCNMHIEEIPVKAKLIKVEKKIIKSEITQNDLI